MQEITLEQVKMMKKQLEDRVALITGGGSEVGKTICIKLAKYGALIAVADFSLHRARETTQKILKVCPNARAYRIEVSSKKDVDQVFRGVLKAFGRLDLLVNNAEIHTITDFEKISEREWDQTLDTNLKGTFLCSQAAFKVMKAQGGGKIINMTSSSSRSGGMVSAGLYRPYAHFAASKAGIESLTRSMAFEGAPYGIWVNGVSLGLTESDLSKMGSCEERKAFVSSIPMGRTMRSEEIASAVVFLASERANYITGKIMDVNGGLLMD